MDFTLFNDPDFRVGQGTRGLKNNEKLIDWDPGKVYIKCLDCSFEWELNKSTWEDNVPNECLSCNTKNLSHEFILLNQIESIEVDPKIVQDKNGNLIAIPGEIRELKENYTALIYRLVRTSNV